MVWTTNGEGCAGPADHLARVGKDHSFTSVNSPQVHRELSQNFDEEVLPPICSGVTENVAAKFDVSKPTTQERILSWAL